MKKHTEMPIRIGLALGGGGARGFCQIAYLKAMDEMGLRPSVISGTSIGAVIGAFYASGYTGCEMEELLKRIGFREIQKIIDPGLFHPTALLKGRGIEEFMREHLRVRTFEKLAIPLKVVATDFWNRTEVVFETGNLIKAVRASLSLPAVFDPVKVRGTVLTDGGAVNPVPYDILKGDCDILAAIDVSGIRKPKRRDRKPLPLESILSTFDIMQDSLVAAKRRSYTPDIYCRPQLVNIGILEFHRTDEIMKSAEPDVARFKRELKRLLSKKNSRFHE
jgi:NTE family protein